MNTMLLSINWNPNPELFNLFGISIRYYGLLWAVGIFFAYVVVHYQYRDKKIEEKKFDPLFFYCFSVIFPLHNSSVICAHFFTDILFILSKFSLYFYVSSCTSARFDMMTAARMITHPITIRSVICSCRMMMENKVPNTDSIDKIIAAFVSSTCFWQAVCKR